MPGLDIPSRAMTNRTVVTMADGVRVVVPDSVDLLTPYVLREQGDWFEDELRFVRLVLEGGQQAIDIGANYGVYALSMAKAVGQNGRVWAFEPASTTADFLAASIAENGFGNVLLERSALSSTMGFASLSLNTNPELNALRQGDVTTDASERVPLVTLDERTTSHGWRDVDFIKIDAEGEELNILRGGTAFFAGMSPLVQYEIRGGEASYAELVGAFAKSGTARTGWYPGSGYWCPSSREIPQTSTCSTCSAASRNVPLASQREDCWLSRHRLRFRNSRPRPDPMAGRRLWRECLMRRG